MRKNWVPISAAICMGSDAVTQRARVDAERGEVLEMLAGGLVAVHLLGDVVLQVADEPRGHRVVRRRARARARARPP